MYVQLLCPFARDHMLYRCSALAIAIADSLLDRGKEWRCISSHPKTFVLHVGSSWKPASYGFADLSRPAIQEKAR